MLYITVFLAFLSSVILLPSVANAEPCRISTTHANLVSGSTILLRSEECPDSDRRVVRVSIQRNKETPQALMRRTQDLNDQAGAGASFIDLENDGVPEIELSSNCNKNCERDIFKLSKDEKSMYHYYKGAYFGVQLTVHYLVTDSYGSYVSWEYLAYDPSPKTYPINNFRYSISISSDNASRELICKINELNSRGKLQLVISPPDELLKFCHHYGDDVPVRIKNIKNGKKRIHGKKNAP